MPEVPECGFMSLPVIKKRGPPREEKMKTETYIYIALGIVILGIFIYRVVTLKRRRNQKLLRLVRRMYGRVPNREYTEPELRKIRSYFDLTREEDRFTVDDITWNDLDMDSIFITINHCFSSVGEEKLYSMLRTPVFSREELSERERLIRAFSGNTSLREKLWVNYATQGRTKKYSMAEFLDQFRDLRLKPDSTYIFHLVLPFIFIAVIFIRPVMGIFSLILAIGYNIYTYYTQKGSIEPYYVSLSAIAYLIASAEKVADADDPEIKDYTGELRELLKPLRAIKRRVSWLGTGVTGTGDIAQILMDYIRMTTHVDFLVFNRMVGMILNHEAEILKLMDTMGYLEALISVASYRETLPFYCNGEFDSEEKRGLYIKDGYHPLIPEPVANSVHENRPLLITGSNASGKSTFLRMAALAVLMSETLNTVHAHSYRAPFYRLYSSMALRDDIQSSESYYIVEVKSLKRVLDAIPDREAPPVIVFVDEILRGTNTVERIAASSEILKMMEEEGAMTVAATHDIELTHMLEDRYANYHFTEEVSDGEILFSYILHPGRSETRNAIRLLSVMGYNEKIVREAEETAERFTSEGVWKLS